MSAGLQFRSGFWRRTGAMLLKEFLQLRRDRVTFATMISIPLMQLVLFGYAINTVPRDLPTAVLVQESSDVSRTILKALENTRYFKVTRRVRDEAERCHEIAYIAYGELLAHGTVEQVIANAHLATYTVSGHDLGRLAEELGDRDGVSMVAPFGASLHVSGRDEAALEAAIAPYRGDPALRWEKSEASLEDVFIELMGQATDNRSDNRRNRK